MTPPWALTVEARRAREARYFMFVLGRRHNSKSRKIPARTANIWRENKCIGDYNFQVQRQRRQAQLLRKPGICGEKNLMAMGEASRYLYSSDLSPLYYKIAIL